MTVEKVLASLMLAACLALLARMLLPERLRQWLDGRLRRGLASIRRFAHNLRHGSSQRKSAARTADEAIRRARRRSAADVDRDGNVIKPRSFQRPPDDV